MVVQVASSKGVLSIGEMLPQDAEIKLAKLANKYDECGIIKPHGQSIAFKKKEVRFSSLPLRRKR